MIIVFLVALVVSAAGFASLIVQLCVTICTLRAEIHRDTISMIYSVAKSVLCYTATLFQNLS